MVGDQAFAAGHDPCAQRVGLDQCLGFSGLGQRVVL